MTVEAPIDWNAWRAQYDQMTYLEHQDLYAEVHARYPEQCHYSVEHVARAIAATAPRTVIELGGWDGELAHTMLDQHPTIEQWTNIEICAAARDSRPDPDPRYEAPELGDWYWTRQWACDLFVASHTIEHLTVDHLDLTIAATDAAALFLDAPLPAYPTDWRDCTGTHILPLNWDGVDELLAGHGYALSWATAHQTPDSSGGTASARLYLRTGATR